MLSLDCCYTFSRDSSASAGLSGLVSAQVARPSSRSRHTRQHHPRLPRLPAREHWQHAANFYQCKHCAHSLRVHADWLWLDPSCLCECRASHQPPSRLIHPQSPIFAAKKNSEQRVIQKKYKRWQWFICQIRIKTSCSVSVSPHLNCSDSLPH